MRYLVIILVFITTLCFGQHEQRLKLTPEVVTVSREFMASDAGKFLVLNSGVNLTMPSIYPFKHKDELYIYSNEGGVEGCTFQEDFGGLPIRLIQNEGLHLLAVNIPNEVQILLSISGSGYTTNGNNEYQTLTRYFYYTIQDLLTRIQILENQ